MAKASEADEVGELKREVADLRRQLGLIIAFLDVETRERQGLTSDQIREMWRASRAQRPCRE